LTRLATLGTLPSRMTYGRRHLVAILGLLCLGTLFQAVVIGRAAMPSLDAVRFVKTAQAVTQQGPLAALRSGGEQPLFPLWVAAVHKAIAWQTGEYPSIWAASVQLAAAVPLVLTVVPLYLLLVCLFDERIAAIGSILFCVLPEVSRLGADGLSDSIHLLFFTAAIWAVVQFWMATGRVAPGRSWQTTPWPALAGLLTGLALLARAEAILLPVALAMSLVLYCASARSKAALRAVTKASGGFVFGLALLLGPYLVLAGADTPRAAVAQVLGRGRAAAAPPLAARGEKSSWQAPDGRPLQFPVKEGSIRRHGYAAAVCQYGEELGDVFGYWLGPLALWALWRHRRELARPADRFLNVFFAVFSLAVVHFVAKEGYLSARHLLPLLVTGLGVAAVGLWDASVLLSRCMILLLRHKRTRCSAGGAPAALGLCVILAVVLVGHLVSASRPLRGDRRAHRQAGTWLARQSRDGLAVLDTRGWTALYSARPTYQYDQAKSALGDPRLGYLVVEQAELGCRSDRAWTLRWLLATAGECVARFDGPSGTSADGVVVYRWHDERFRPSNRLARAGV